MDNQERRQSKRAFGQWTVAIRFTDTATGQPVGETVPGKLADASFTGCRVVCGALAGEVQEKLRLGEWMMTVTTHSPNDGAEIKVSGRAKWVDQSGQVTTIGLQYVVSEATQPRLADLLRGQTKTSQTPLIVAGVAVSVVIGLWLLLGNKTTPPAAPSAPTALTVTPPKKQRGVVHETAAEDTAADQAGDIDPPPEPINEVLIASSTEKIEVDGQVVEYELRLNKPMPDVSVVRVVMTDAAGHIVPGCVRLVRMEFDETSMRQHCLADADIKGPLALKVYYAEAYQFGVEKGQPRPQPHAEPERR